MLAAWAGARPAQALHGRRRGAMTVGVVVLQPLIALLAGILILLVPRILNYIVAIYLIFVGLTGLWPHLIH
jgi:hypothetical protein